MADSWHHRSALYERLERIWDALVADEGRELVELIDDFCVWWLARRTATHAVLTFTQTEEGTMPAGFTVDTTSGKVTLGFTDDHGDTDAAAPAGLDALVWSSDTGTVTQDAGNPLAADISGQVEPSITVSVGPLTVSGAPALEADGVTPLPAVPPLTIPVVAGPATGEALSASS